MMGRLVDRQSLQYKHKVSLALINQDCDVIHKTATNATEPMSIFMYSLCFDLHSLFDEDENLPSLMFTGVLKSFLSLRCSLNAF